MVLRRPGSLLMADRFPLRPVTVHVAVAVSCGVHGDVPRRDRQSRYSDDRRDCLAWSSDTEQAEREPGFGERPKQGYAAFGDPVRKLCERGRHPQRVSTRRGRRS